MDFIPHAKSNILTDIIGIDITNFNDTMNKLKFITLGLIFSLSAAFYSCDKEEGDDKEVYSLSETIWIYADEENGGQNTFEFIDGQTVSFTQDWIDTGVEYTETKSGTYTYNHPAVSITVGSKEYAGTVDGETINIGGFVYNKQ